MVVLNFESLDSTVDLKDVYVSVRVGESQRLSRISKNVSYSFPKTSDGDSRYGTLDIFHRIGTANIGINPEACAMQEIRVPVNADMSHMKFRLVISDTKLDTEKNYAEINKEMRTNAAKQYLQKHNLDVRLLQAMKAMFREQPEDPVAFLSETLHKSAGQIKQIGRLRALATPVAQSPTNDSPGNSEHMREELQQALTTVQSNGRLDETLAGLNVPETECFSRESTLEIASERSVATPTSLMLEQPQDQARLRLLASGVIALIEASADGRLAAALYQAAVDDEVAKPFKSISDTTTAPADGSNAAQAPPFQAPTVTRARAVNYMAAAPMVTTAAPLATTVAPTGNAALEREYAMAARYQYVSAALPPVRAAQAVNYHYVSAALPPVTEAREVEDEAAPTTVMPATTYATAAPVMTPQLFGTAPSMARVTYAAELPRASTPGSAGYVTSPAPTDTMARAPMTSNLQRLTPFQTPQTQLVVMPVRHSTWF